LGHLWEDYGRCMGKYWEIVEVELVMIDRMS